MVKVILKFGAYEAYGVLKYRPERLYVLIGELLSQGFTVEIYPWIHVNRLGIFVAGRLIFTCRLTYLSLFECNQTCSLAISKVLEALQTLCLHKKLSAKPSENEKLKDCEDLCPTEMNKTANLEESDIPINTEIGITTANDSLTNPEKLVTPNNT